MRDITLPSNQTLVYEMFSWLEFPGLLLTAPELLSQKRGDGRPVIVMPGFGAGDLSTAPLRQYLQALGYHVRGWNQGNNTGEVLELLEAMKSATVAEYERADNKIDLIGWSLGGYIAREVARELPDKVRSVITLGSPVVGGPKYTRVAPVFRSQGIDLDQIEKEVDDRYETPLKVPVTAIYSKNDGVVAWEACIDHRSDCVEHVEVIASHIGLGFSADVYRIIASKLAS